VTVRREVFTWVTILFTFALGTAAGVLVSEKVFQSGSDDNPTFNDWGAALVFAACIAASYLAHRFGVLGAVLAFWLAYTLTRPLGASLGDYLSQPTEVGGESGHRYHQPALPGGDPGARGLPDSDQDRPHSAGPHQPGAGQRREGPLTARRPAAQTQAPLHPAH